MKICFVLPSLNGGGAERGAVMVLSALDGARHQRSMFLFRREGAYFHLLSPDIRLVTASRTGRLGRLLDLVSFLRAERPDVVMPFLSYFIASVAVTLSGVNARVVFNQGSPTTGFLEDPDYAWRQPWRRRLFAILTRIFYGRATAVVTTSNGIADDLVRNYGVPDAKIRVVPNPIDLDAIVKAAAEPIDDPLDGEGPVVAAAGRLASVKNYPLLIDAVASLASECPPRVWILGDGAERAALEARVERAGMRARTSFLGFQQNPWRFIRRADVFVLTSMYEGFGNVLIEAMACGTPVVATRSYGTTDIVQHEVNGLLVDHEPSAVAGAIARILGDGALRARLLSAAHRSVEQYAVPRVVERYERIFQEVMA